MPGFCACFCAVCSTYSGFAMFVQFVGYVLPAIASARDTSMWRSSIRPLAKAVSIRKRARTQNEHALTRRRGEGEQSIGVMLCVFCAVDSLSIAS